VAAYIRFREKGGKEKEIPVHHKLEEYLDVYLKAAKLSEQPGSPLFRSTRGRSRELGTDGLSRKDAWAMLKRRLRDAGLSTIYSNHSFRAAGITNYLENDGTLEVAQRIAGHADSRTTKLYDRRGQRCSSKTWRGFDIPDSQSGVPVRHSGFESHPFRVSG